MEAHFAQCKHCTAVLDGARNVVQLYGDDRLFELPAGFSRRLQRRLAGESGSSSICWLALVLDAGSRGRRSDCGRGGAGQLQRLHAHRRALPPRPARLQNPSRTEGCSFQRRPIVSRPRLPVSAQQSRRESRDDDRVASHARRLRPLSTLPAAISERNRRVPAPRDQVRSLCGAAGRAHGIRIQALHPRPGFVSRSRFSDAIPTPPTPTPLKSSEFFMKRSARNRTHACQPTKVAVLTHRAPLFTVR